MIPDTSCPTAILSGGQSLKIKRVALYKEEEVREIATMKAEALKLFEGVSTGIGFFGSPEWALGGAAALSIVEGLLSSAMRKQGVELLKEMQQKALSLANDMRLFDAHEIRSINSPDPSLWHSTGIITSYVEPADATKIRAAMKRHGISNYLIDQLPQGIHKQESEHHYVHNGSEFILVDTEYGLVNIRWSCIIAYWPPASN